MTNRIALFLFLLIVAGFVADGVFNQGQAALFLGRKFYEFLGWIAFWR